AAPHHRRRVTRPRPDLHRRRTACRAVARAGGHQRRHGPPPARSRPRWAHEDRARHRRGDRGPAPRIHHGRSDRAVGGQPRLRQLGGADEPVAGGGHGPRGPSPAPGSRRPGGRAEVQLHRRAQRAGARQRPRDGGARRRRRGREGLPAGARRRDRLPRRADRRRARGAARGARAGRLRRRRRVARALPGRRHVARDGRGDQRAAQAQRVAGRRLRAARLRPRARPRLSRLVGGAPGRPHRSRHALDPGLQGRRPGRRLRPGGPAGLGRPRRDLLLRGARLVSRDQSLGRPRGRHDDRRAARRAGRHEAAAHPHQAAAVGRHLHPPAGPGAARAHRLGRRPGRRRGRRGHAGRRPGRRLPPEVRRRPHRRRPRRGGGLRAAHRVAAGGV
ncbi:MAG: Chorismate synthase, partial [uncultured Solirubrobacteraceae bacterium]